jgi:hypothetical protein
MTVRFSALCALYHLRRFLVLISVRSSVDPRAIAWLEGLGQLKKKSNDLIGIRNRNLTACSIVPQPTTLPRAPPIGEYKFKYTEDDESKSRDITLLDFYKYPYSLPGDKVLVVRNYA